MSLSILRFVCIDLLLTHAGGSRGGSGIYRCLSVCIFWSQTVKGQGHESENGAGVGFCTLVSAGFLGRLPMEVDLIPWVANFRPSVRPQKVSSISMKFGIQVVLDER